MTEYVSTLKHSVWERERETEQWPGSSRRAKFTPLWWCNPPATFTCVQVSVAEPTNPVARAAWKSLSTVADPRSVNTREHGVSKQWLQKRGIMLFKAFWVIFVVWHVVATLGSWGMDSTFSFVSVHSTYALMLEYDTWFLLPGTYALEA